MKIYCIEAESKQMLVDIVKKVKTSFDFRVALVHRIIRRLLVARASAISMI